MTLMTPEISKQLGWGQATVQTYPDCYDVQHASDYMICKWHRFLRSPKNKEQRQIMAIIVDKYNDDPA